MGKRGVHLNDERCFLRSAKWLVCVFGSVVRNFCHSSELFDIQVFISGRLRFTLECARLSTLRTSMGKGWMWWTMFSEVSEVTCLCIGLCCSKFLSFIRIIWHSGFHFWSFKFYARMRKALNVADLEDRCTFGSTTHMHEGVMIFDERGYFRLNRSENFR